MSIITPAATLTRNPIAPIQEEVCLHWAPTEEVLPSETVDRLGLGAWRHFYVSRQHGLVTTFSDLYKIASPNDDEDAAALDTINRAVQILSFAYNHMSDHFFPVGMVGVTPNLGIRIEWMNDGRHVRLFIPADEKGEAYLYRQAGNEREMKKQPTAEAIADMLNWLKKSTGSKT